jgi:hypothetical protein
MGSVHAEERESVESGGHLQMSREVESGGYLKIFREDRNNTTQVIQRWSTVDRTVDASTVPRTSSYVEHKYLERPDRWLEKR